jgi:hypothetical protein
MRRLINQRDECLQQADAEPHADMQARFAEYRRAPEPSVRWRTQGYALSRFWTLPVVLSVNGRIAAILAGTLTGRLWPIRADRSVAMQGGSAWAIGRSCLDAACFRIEARRTHRRGHRAGIAPGARSPHHGHTAHGHRRLGQFARRGSPWVSSGSRRSPPSFAGG